MPFWRCWLDFFTALSAQIINMVVAHLAGGANKSQNFISTRNISGEAPGNLYNAWKLLELLLHNSPAHKNFLTFHLFNLAHHLMTTIMFYLYGS